MTRHSHPVPVLEELKEGLGQEPEEFGPDATATKRPTAD